MAQDFVSHLEELRKRLLISLAAFFVASIASYFFAPYLLEFLTGPLRRFNQTGLFFTKPYEAFLTHLKVAAMTGFLAATPVIFTQIWLFVTPGLYEREKRMVFPLVLISVFLFLTGAAFAFLVVIPFGLHFLLSFQTEGLKPLLGISPYFSFLTGMVFAFGILFDFPVLVVGAVKLGAISCEALSKARRLVIVLIFIAAAILTPSPDPVSQLLLAGPLLILFEISLLIAKSTEKKK